MNSQYSSFNEGDIVTTNCKGFDPASKWEYHGVVSMPVQGLPVYAEIRRFTHIRAVVPLSSLKASVPTKVEVKDVAKWLKDSDSPQAETFVDEFGEL